MEINKDSDYSWFSVHYKNFVKEFKVLCAGIAKNFRRVSWHFGRNLTIEYLQVIGILIFMSLFCYLVSII